MSPALWTLCAIGAVLVVVTIYDLTQKRRAILRNFPIVGHFRYLFEMVGPELRQYIVTGNDEERPFSRDQRRWVYASSKQENNYFGFGTDNDLEQASSYVIVRHAAFPLAPPRATPGYRPHLRAVRQAARRQARSRKGAFRPGSIVNTSAMSYGSLSGAAVEAINRGVALAGALQNTGEGGISDYHRKGGDLVWQIGTGYFGCRDAKGGFSLERFLETVASAPVRAIEIKLSQGAKPGLGGVLPGRQDHPRDRPHPRHPDGPGLHQPGRAHGLPRRRRRCSTSSSASPTPPACRSASSRPSARWASGTSWRGRSTDRPRPRLHHHRRRRGRHRRRAAGVHRPRRAALQARLRRGLQGPSPSAGVHEDVVFIGSGKLGFPETALLALASAAT
jgi:hypothetical protein